MLELQILVPVVLLLTHLNRASYWSSIGAEGYWLMRGALPQSSKALLIISVVLAAFGPPWLAPGPLLFCVAFPYVAHLGLMVIAFERHERSSRPK